MKKLLLLIGIGLLAALHLGAQSVPRGMKYQAVLRDPSGNLLKESPFSVKVDFLASESEGTVLYSELHALQSTNLGLLNLTLGEGKRMKGRFEDIPWSTQNIWVQVSIKPEADAEYRMINSSQLYSVPYAYFAETAGKLNNATLHDASAPVGMNSNNWVLEANQNASHRNNGNPILGTVDSNALVVVTNNIPRLILAVNGNANFKTNLAVEGDLNTDQQVILNTASGNTTIHGSTTVASMSPTLLTGTLRVGKATVLEDSLLVANMASTHLTGSLDLDKAMNVDGATTLNGSLDVKNMSQTQLTGPLTVDGIITLGDALTIGNMAPTHFTGTLDVDKTLNVDGATTLNNSLNVTNMSSTHLTGILGVDKTVTLNNTLTVGNMSPSLFTGTLKVDKTLTVDGIATFKNALTVSGMFPTHLTGSLTVDKLLNFNAGLHVVGTGTLGGGGADLALFENVTGGSSDGIGIKIRNNNVDKLNNFMTFYRGTGSTVAGRIEGYHFGDIADVPEPTSDEIWTAICLALADYNPVTIAWTQLASKFNGVAYLWNNTTIPSFDIPDIPPFTITDVPSLTIPDVPAFVTSDVPGFSIPDIPGVVIPNIPSLSVGPYLCAEVCGCPCSIDITDWNCCCGEVCLVPSFTLFPGITIPDFPGIAIPDFPGIPIPDFPGIPIPDFPGIPIPDFPGLVIPTVPSINLAATFGSMPTIPTLSDILVAEGICPNADIFNTSTGYLARLAAWAFEHRLQNLVTLDPIALLGNALAWAATTSVLDNAVVYGSKGADYAEYLPKLHNSEKFLKGEIVGVRNGMISKDTRHADQILAISSNPVILGNLPDAEEANYEKVAFLGQVPLFVQGPVQVGDYIIPSGQGDGTGRAVPASLLTVDMISQVLGTSWSEFKGSGIGMINASLGLKPTEISEILKKQGAWEQKLLNQVQAQANETDLLTGDIQELKQFLGIADKK